MWMLQSMLTLLILGGVSFAGDWPQWLGPNRNGISDEKLTPWKTVEEVWKHEVGEGHSSPILADGALFLHTKVPGKTAERITAYDAKTGKELWSQSYEHAEFEGVKIFGVGPRSTPLHSDGKVYTYGLTGTLSCWDHKNKGKLVWSVDTRKEFSPPSLRFGVSCSPVLAGSNVVVQVGGKGQAIVAFDKDTGKVAWKTGDDPASYSSPILIGKAGSQRLIFLTGAHVMSVDSTQGRIHWKIPLRDLLNESSTTPVKSGDYLLASSVTFGGMGIKLKSEKGAPSAEKLWTNRALNCYFSTPIVVDEDHMYLITGKLLPPPSSILHCVDVRTGKSLWSKKDIAKYHAALLRTANDKLLMLDDGGHLTLLEPSLKEYKELAKSKVCGATWAHPALVDEHVYIRDEKSLYCLKPKE